MTSSPFTAPPLATSTWELLLEKPSMQRGNLTNFISHFSSKGTPSEAMKQYFNETYIFRLAREAEERRRRLTSHRLLQPRTTASIRNRYLCKVKSECISNITMLSRLVLVFQVILGMGHFQWRRDSLSAECQIQIPDVKF